MLRKVVGSLFMIQASLILAQDCPEPIGRLPGGPSSAVVVDGTLAFTLGIDGADVNNEVVARLEQGNVVGIMDWRELDPTLVAGWLVRIDRPCGGAGVVHRGNVRRRRMRQL